MMGNNSLAVRERETGRLLIVTAVERRRNQWGYMLCCRCVDLDGHLVDQSKPWWKLWSEESQDLSGYLARLARLPGAWPDMVRDELAALDASKVRRGAERLSEEASDGADRWATSGRP